MSSAKEYRRIMLGAKSANAVTKSARAISLSQSACIPEITLISLRPKMGKSPARMRGANHAIGKRISKARLAIRKMFSMKGPINT